jgi:hypothetical protein
VPTPLARDILAHGLSLLPEDTAVRFLDPAIGTGAFFAALQSMGSARVMASATGVEIDPHYGVPAKALWSGTALDYQIADFTRLTPPADRHQRANLLICNPPYVRHHHLEATEKTRLRARAKETARIDLSGLAGLYCHFMALAHPWMDDGAIAGWLIPSEFMDVNYGSALKDYLLREVTLLHIHRFDPDNVQFEDALVSSAVVWFRKEKPPTGHHVRFSYGGSLTAPALVKSIAATDLQTAPKWTRFPSRDPAAEHSGWRLADLFAIRRGIATGGNHFFILPEADARALGLLDCPLPEEDIRRDDPRLWTYLQTGADTVAKAYLCQHRKHWYAQEQRPPAPIVCTYLGRSDTGRPFRFLLNHSQATATNVFLMLYPHPVLARQLALDPSAMRRVWGALNAIRPETLTGEGRVYGGGLHKLEPKELANVPADDLAALVGLPRKTAPAGQPSHQLSLLQDQEDFTWA